MPKLAIAAFALVTAVPAFASAASYAVAPGEDVASAIDGLQPGDELVFEAGEHDLGEGLDVVLDGTANADITLRGAIGAFINSSGDTLRVSGSYVVIRDLELQGSGTALALVGENISVYDNVFSGGATGLSCEDCDAVVIAHNEFRGTTSAQSAAITSDAITNSALRNNWVHDVAGGGVSLDGRAVNTLVVDNVIAATGGDGISVEYPDTLDDGAPGNIVVANYISDSGARGIAVVGPVTIANNIVIGSASDGIATIATQVAVAEPIDVLHNTVSGDGTCLRATAWSLSPSPNRVVNNALYCASGDAFRFDDGVGMQSFVGRNIYLGAADFPGDSILGNDLSDFAMADTGDFYPAPGSPLIDGGDPNVNVDADFDGTVRDELPDFGAYEATVDANPFGVPDGFKLDVIPDNGDDTGNSTSDPDAGAGGPNGGASGGASGFGDRDPQGCSCSSTTPSPWLPAILLGGVFFGLRRRRRR